MFLGWFPFVGGSFVFLDFRSSHFVLCIQPFFFWQGFIIAIWCFITRLYNWKLQGGFLGGVGALGLVGVWGRPRDMLELTTLRKWLSKCGCKQYNKSSTVKQITHAPTCGLQVTTRHPTIPRLMREHTHQLLYDKGKHETNMKQFVVNTKHQARISAHMQVLDEYPLSLHQEFQPICKLTSTHSPFLAHTWRTELSQKFKGKCAWRCRLIRMSTHSYQGLFTKAQIWGHSEPAPTSAPSRMDDMCDQETVLCWVPVPYLTMLVSSVGLFTTYQLGRY